MKSFAVILSTLLATAFYRPLEAFPFIRDGDVIGDVALLDLGTLHKGDADLYGPMFEYEELEDRKLIIDDVFNGYEDSDEYWSSEEQDEDYSEEESEITYEEREEEGSSMEHEIDVLDESEGEDSAIDDTEASMSPVSADESTTTIYLETQTDMPVDAVAVTDMEDLTTLQSIEDVETATTSQ